jgi:XTP/dITP diphosphohydrolase
VREIAFVTGNKGKLEEVQHALGQVGVTVTQSDVTPVEVQADDLVTVARAKALDAAQTLEGPVLVDDAGLFVNALNGFPGVYAAHALNTIGLDGLLKLLEGVDERRARFECVLALAESPDGPVRTFTGVCPGAIATEPRSGGHGFGFDPVFVPEGHVETFADLPLEKKNALSHRGRAVEKLVAHFRDA